MADPLSLAASVAGLISLSLQLGHATHSYVSGVLDATKSQRRYLQEVLALSEVLARLEDALQDFEAKPGASVHGSTLSDQLLLECRDELEIQSSKLSRGKSSLGRYTQRLAWPFQEKEVKKAIEDLHRFRQLFSDFLAATTSDRITVTLRQVQSIKNDQVRDRLLDKLRVSPDVLKRPPEPLADTGSWLINDPVFRNWIVGSPSTLRCYGPPGVGKSALSLIVARHLALRHHKTVVSFFSDFARRKEQTEVVILRSLLYQLMTQRSGEALADLIRSCDGLSDDSSGPDLARIFENACREKDVVLVFDALDESHNAKRLTSQFEKFRASGCQVMLTGRDFPDANTAAAYTVDIEVRAHDTDLARYVQRRFDETEVGDLVGDDHPLVQAIVKKSDGIFLLARLLLDNLLSLPTLKKMRKTLDSSPAHIDEAYESSLKRIESQPKALCDLAHRAFDWVLRMKRPLRPVELIHAFVVDEEDEDLDMENLTTLQVILRACAGLLIVDETHDGIVFVHFSAYEFFAKKQSENAAEEDIAKTCLSYLQLAPFRKGACASIDELKLRFQQNPFLDYAAHHWGTHASVEAIGQHLKRQIQSFLDHPGCLSSAFQALNYRLTIKDDDVAAATFESLPTGQSRLHVAAYWGLQRIISHLLCEGDDVRATDSQGWTALHWAASRSHLEATRLLLEASTPVDAQDERGWTAAMWSSVRGDVAALRLLLDRGANVTLKDVNGWNALRWAMSARQPLAVGTLQKASKDQLVAAVHKKATVSEIRGLEESSQLSDVGKSVIEWAAGLEDEEAFDKALIHFGSDDEYWNSMWTHGHLCPPIANLWRLYQKGMRNTNLKIMRPNPWRGAGSQASDSVTEGENADNQIYQNSQGHPYAAEISREMQWKSALLCSAVKDGNLATVKMLLELGADANYMNPSDVGKSALHVAAYKEDSGFVRALVAHGADVSRKDDCGQTALHCAVMNGLESTAAALLEAGSDVNDRRGFKKDKDSPVYADFIKARYKHGMSCPVRSSNYDTDDPEIARVEEATGAPQDYMGRTPIMLACGYGMEHDNKRMIDVLTHAGADLLCQDFGGWTTLHYAASCNQIDLANSALKAGVDMNAQDDGGYTALHLAFTASSVEFVKLLLANGASPGILDESGRHAVHHLDWRYVLTDTDTTTLELYRLVCPSPPASVLSGVIKDSGEETALRMAISRGYWALADALLLDGATFSNTTTLCNALETAVEHLRIDYVQLLAGPTGRHEALPESRRDYSQYLTMAMKRLKNQNSLEIYNQIMQTLQAEGFTWGSDPHVPIELAAAKTCDLQDLPGLLSEHGIDFLGLPCEQRIMYLPPIFTTDDAPRHDAFVTAACSGNYRFLLGLMDTARRSAPTGHWLSSIPADEKFLYESKTQVLQLYCSSLSRSKLLDAPVNRDSSSLLCAAIDESNQDLITQLLDRGADINAKDRYGWQPIHWAALRGDKTIVETLIARGADVQAGMTSWPRHRMSGPFCMDKPLSWPLNALHIACAMVNIEAVGSLLLHGIDIDVPHRSVEATRKGVNNRSSKRVWTPLQLVLCTGDFRSPDRGKERLSPTRLLIARMLLERGVDVWGIGATFREEDPFEWNDGRPKTRAWHRFEGFEDVWDRLQQANEDEKDV